MASDNIFSKSISTQQQLLYKQLSRLLKEDMRVALLDFPNHNNVGDNAIWLGEKVALKNIGVKVVYQCDLFSFSETALRKNLGKNGVILLHGGGNLGTVWPHHQEFRERIIQSFPKFKIIQLPQSASFENDESLAQFKSVAEKHKDVHILVRDRNSYELLRAQGLQVEMCPDMALAIGPVASDIDPVVDLVWLSRTDRESVGTGVGDIKATVEKLDWLFGDPSRPYLNYTMRYSVPIRVLTQKAFKKSKFLRDYAWRLNSSFFDLLARRRFERGVRILGRGKVVITDRLHGHILSTLLGKHQVLLDNSYKKIGNYISCFSPAVKGIFYLGNDPTDLPGETEKALRAFEKSKDNEG